MKSLALATLVGAQLLALFGGGCCRRSAVTALDLDWRRLEADRIQLAQRVALLRVRLEKIEAREKELAQLVSDSAHSSERLGLLLERADELRAGIEAESERLAQLREQRLQGNREASLGRAFEVFQGPGGRAYQDVVITRVSDIGIEFRHASGSARLTAAELTDGQREAFGLKSELSGEALAAERRTAQSYASWVERKLAQIATQEFSGERFAAAESPQALVKPVFRSSLRDQPRSFGNRSPRSSRVRYRTVWYPAVPSVQTLYCPSNGDQNIRVPSATLSFSMKPFCIPTPLCTLPVTDTP